MIGLKKQCNLALVTTMLVGVAITGASASVLTGNLANATGGVEEANVNRWLTASFATDASEYTLSSITLLLANPVAGEVSLDLYSDGSLEPGFLIATLDSPDNYSTEMSPTTFVANGLPLEAHSIYWVVLRVISGTFSWSWTPINTGFGVGYENTWGVSDGDGTAWYSINVYPTQFRVVAFSDDTSIGDFDGDVDIDSDDYGEFSLCMYGPEAAPDPSPTPTSQECIIYFDVDDQADVDLLDFAEFQNTFQP